MKVVGVGLPKTGTTTLKRALEILGVDHEVGDHVHMGDEYPMADHYILTVRKSTDTWYNSVLRWNKKVGNRPEIQAQRIKMYGSKQPKDEWRENYEVHNRMWKTVPKTHVMCWECGDGWLELCDALGLDIPNEPFPHLNANK